MCLGCRSTGEGCVASQKSAGKFESYSVRLVRNIWQSLYMDILNVPLQFLLDIESKAVLFFLPIGMALLINTVIFFLTVKSVCDMDKQARDLGITTGQRSKKMERYKIITDTKFTYIYS